MILKCSDPNFNTVLMRFPNVFVIFTVHSSRFLKEIQDFDQFSYAPVDDFSKKRCFWTVSRKRIASKCVHFRGVFRLQSVD